MLVIYDPPMLHRPIKEWQEYLEVVLALPGNHNEEIDRVRAVIESKKLKH